MFRLSDTYFFSKSLYKPKGNDFLKNFSLLSSDFLRLSIDLMTYQ